MNTDKGMNKKRLRRSDSELEIEALKYTRKVDFQHGSNAHYKQAWRKGSEFLNKICSHMDIEWEPKWPTMESVQLEAHKYADRTSFARGSAGAYDKAQRMGWLDKICSFMGEKPNKAYTIVELKKIALNYKTIVSFRRGNNGAYHATHNLGVMSLVCSHMKKHGDVSTLEQDLLQRLMSFYPTSRRLRDHKVNILDKPHIHGFDLDIFIPELNKGIEFDGTYWHSDKGLKRSRKHWPQEDIDNYHQIKDNYFASKGIQILHIKENDWIKNKEACIQECLDFLRGENVELIA